jgi:NAD(P)-dependent dehydrogenase (short-subunit alcohol dehydrogenase family)
MRLENKIGIVTAAASGMGRAGAIRFAAEGASVAVVDLNKEATDAVVRQITAAGGKAIGLSRSTSAASSSSGTMSVRPVRPPSKGWTGRSSISRLT